MLQGFIQIALTLLILVVITPFFGRYMARVYLGERTFLDPVIMPVERAFYALGDVRFKDEMSGWH